MYKFNKYSGSINIMIGDKKVFVKNFFYFVFIMALPSVYVYHYCTMS